MTGALEVVLSASVIVLSLGLAGTTWLSLHRTGNRRLIFIHRRAADTTHNTGLWYLDYQRFSTHGIRITFADHGPLVDAITIAATGIAYSN